MTPLIGSGETRDVRLPSGSTATVKRMTFGISARCQQAAMKEHLKLSQDLRSAGQAAASQERTEAQQRESHYQMFHVPTLLEHLLLEVDGEGKAAAGWADRLLAADARHLARNIIDADDPWTAEGNG